MTAMKRHQFQHLFSDAAIFEYTQAPGSVTPGTGVRVEETEAGIVEDDLVLANITSADGTASDITVTARAKAGAIEFFYTKVASGAADPGNVTVRAFVLRPVPGLVTD